MKRALASRLFVKSIVLTKFAVMMAVAGAAVSVPMGWTVSPASAAAAFRIVRARNVATTDVAEAVVFAKLACSATTESAVLE